MCHNSFPFVSDCPSVCTVSSGRVASQSSCIPEKIPPLSSIDAFYQTQEAALQMMADMGAPVEGTSFKVSRLKVSHPYIHFRTIGQVVLVTLRFQYVRQRKIEYLQANVSKLSHSPSVATTFGFSPPQAVAPSHSKEQVHSHKPHLPLFFKASQTHADSKSKSMKKSEGSSSKHSGMLSQNQHQPSSFPKTLKQGQNQSMKQASLAMVQRQIRLVILS